MNPLIVKLLKSGHIGVIPTDTIYGLVGLASSKSAVEKIYKVKKRGAKKPLIILISSINDLKKFGIKITPENAKIIKNVWPGLVSVLLECKHKKFLYLHRGTGKLAFRLPKDKNLIKFLKATGPLVAPSANPENLKPAEDIKMAQKYFGASVDFYVDAGKIKSQPSSLVDITGEEPIMLRKGQGKFKI